MRTPEQAERCLELASIRVPDTSFVEQVRALGVEDELLETGLAELAAVVDGCAAVAGDRVTVEANLRIARGLDYYTGTVVEIFMSGYEHLKSVGGGGRYDALADDGKNVYPGVGRVLRCLADAGPADRRRRAGRQPVGAERGAGRPGRRGVAADQRRGGDGAAGPRASPCEVAASPQKFGKQIRSAERRGIPFVWFPPAQPTAASTRSRTSAAATRSPADPATWAPPDEDLRPHVVH